MQLFRKIMTMIGTAIMFATLNGCVTPPVSPAENLVRLTRITVDPEQLEQYNAFLKEEIADSLTQEPGVIALYAVSEKQMPSRFTIIEIYADEKARQQHLQTPHFRKYKDGTRDMVKELELTDVIPLFPEMTIK